MRQLPAIVVHGGAWAIPDEMVEAHTRGVQGALDKGWHVLEGGGSALDAVEAAIVCMEDDETFDAGRGSFLTRDGRVQLDALMMDGATLRAGGVGCVERIRNPIRASRLVLEKALMFTLSQKVRSVLPRSLVCRFAVMRSWLSSARSSI